MNSELFPYSPAAETLNPAEIETLQNDLLRRQLVYCRDNSPFYRERLKGMDFSNATEDSSSAENTSHKRNETLIVPLSGEKDIALPIKL